MQRKETKIDKWVFNWLFYPTGFLIVATLSILFLMVPLLMTGWEAMTVWLEVVVGVLFGAVGLALFIGITSGMWQGGRP